MRVSVILEASRRKQAVCVRAGRGVVGLWVVRKVETHAGFGVRDLVAVSWADIWAARFDISLEFQHEVQPSLLNEVARATVAVWIIGNSVRPPDPDYSINSADPCSYDS